ncbi:tripartite motif-containing protein 5-like [Hyla sarda]|uniref:tripartite motif-containing protein 5-like n=1 Tax=Hyla sarda TaxID=327740 RepID=UPI0024C2F526|nr:tripartite motif-containing protein 5-like [Hyla sarda]
MEASLTCAVCLGVFREPVTLPRCSHNFCKSCVLECATPHMWTVVQPRNGQYGTVSCPLCRKVSTLAGGLAALPVNTTLAEIVRLLPQTGRAKEGPSAGATGGDAEPVHNGSGKNSCAEHPEYRLELFCKNCEQACCGKCVSLRHQGIFHNVNLLDMIYQEEKLVFFNGLKTLREIHERLTKEMSDNEKNAESILKANEDAVTFALGEVQKALDVKKQQLLDLVKQQQSAAMKRNEVRKVTKAHHKTTVESLLKDCEKLVDDYEPKSFLQVACGLNKRMKSNLELMEFCSDRSEDMFKIEPQCVDVKAVLDAVSALAITSSFKDVSKQNGSFSFKSRSRTWNDGMTTNEKYCPVQDEELIYLQGQMQRMTIRFVCISKMPEYQHLSYEELRLKYYEPSVVQEKEAVSTSERQRPFFCNNNGVNFKIPLSGVKPTKLKRQDAFDWERTAYGKAVFKGKSTKTDLGRMEQKDSFFTCALRKDDPVKVGPFASSLLGELPSKVETSPKITNDMDNTGLFPNFCLGKSENATIKKSSRNEKSCKKMKSTSCLPKFLSAGSAASVGNVEETMSVSSASSEEFYDANINIDPDLEQPCGLRSTIHNSTDSDKSSTLQGSPH